MENVRNQGVQTGHEDGNSRALESFKPLNAERSLGNLLARLDAAGCTSAAKLAIVETMVAPASAKGTTADAAGLDALARITDYAESAQEAEAKAFFWAVESVAPAKQIMGEEVIGFAKRIGPGPATAYWKAIAYTGEPHALTQKRIFDFSDQVGPEATESYFLRLASCTAKEFHPLTDDGTLKTLVEARFQAIVNEVNADAKKQ